MSKKQKRILWPTLFVILAASGVLGLLAARTRARSVGMEPATTSSLEVPQRERGPVRMVRFVLFAEGIYPRELHVQAGLINITIEDKTNSTAGLVIERVTGSERSRAGEVRRFANHWRGKEVIRLSPGRYHVYDASRPRNQAELVVEP